MAHKILRAAAPAVLLAALAAAFPTLQNVAYAQASPSVAVNLNSPGSVTEGAPIAVTMSFGNLAFDSDRSTIDYTFRADVVGADECEGNRVGVTRYIYQVDENPEVREGAISASCPTGDYAVQASISSPDNVELASASAAFSVAAPDDQPEFSAPSIEEVPLVTAQANAGSEGSSIGLGWGAVSGATHYVIERSSKGPYREWTVDTRTFTDTEILGDHVYTYFVRAKNASGLGPRSRPVIVRSLVQGNITPKAPDGLRASEATAGRVVLNWTQFQRVNTAAGLRISGFRIRRQNLDDGSDLMCGRNPDGAQAQADYWYCHNRQFVLAASCCGERGTSYTDSTVRPDTQYRYWIQAINTNGVGDRSDPVLIRTKRTAATPLAPGLLNPWESSNARGTVNLKWSASASTVGITNYVLQRKLAGAAWVTLNISGWAFETSVQGDHQYVEWQDTGVSANSAYSYRVAAINSAGQGEWSDELSIETEGIAGSPARPRMFKAHRHASDPSILVATWEAVPTASTYVLKVYDVHDNNRLFLNQTTTDGSTSYEVRSVAPNTAYVFKLHATNSANLNGAAATAHVTSAAALGTPVVGSLAVDVYTGGQVQPGFRMYDFKWEPFEGCRHRYRIQYYDTVNAMQSNWSWKHFYDLNTHFPPSQRRVTKVSNASPHERASLGGVIFRVACINQVNANYWEAHGVVAEAAVDIPSASADSAMATAAPPILTAVGGNGEVVLTWDAPENDGGAEITDYEYRINRSGPWIPIGSTDTTYTVTGLVNGTSYVFEVRAVNAAGRSASTNRAEATPELFTLDFAHFANGDGITSDLVFVNVGTHPIRPLLYFYDQEGQPMAAESVVDITGDLEIQEDGSLSIQTEMEPLGELTISTHGQGELVSGSVKVDAGGPIGGVLRFNLPDIGVAGVGPSTPVRDVVFPVRRQEGGINTGVAIHNLESSAEIVRCELMREGVLHDAVSIPLAANGQSSWFINEVFTGADTSDFAGVGALRCSRSGDIRRRGPGTGCRQPHLHHPAGVSDAARRRPVGGADLCAFRQWGWHHLRSGVRESIHRAEPSRAHPLSFGHPSGPARSLFLRHRGRAAGSGIGGGRHRRSGGHRGRRVNGPDGNGTAGSAHDFDPRSRGVGERIGAGDRGRAHRRGAAL